jgi:hypothetical protein
VLVTTPGDGVRIYVVWVPKQGGKEKDVTPATATVPDPRARHYWDAAGTLLRTFRPALGLKGDAWDVYLIYPPGVRWGGGALPAPLHWMHQLWEVWDKGGHLDPPLFRKQLQTALDGAASGR